MTLEEEIFKKMKVDFGALESFGFQKKEKEYYYSKEFMKHFKAHIKVNENGIVIGKVFDLQTGDEYIAFRMDYNRGEFAGSIREYYEQILKEIRDNCFVKNTFLLEQSNRITNYILKEYNTSPEFLWDNFPNYGVFRNIKNNKWFGVMMNIDKSKIMKDTGETEILVLKIEEEKLTNLLKKTGIYKAYHMNKKNWISIVLDDTLTDKEIENLIDTSYSLINESSEWIIPANPKYFDVIHHFQNEDSIEWKQSSKVEIGDIVYIYMANPYSSILYKCEALEINKPYIYQDKNLKMQKVMKLKLIEKYEEGKISFERLQKWGITSIRGPRKITKEISKNFK